jgi:hypothetical protein
VLTAFLRWFIALSEGRGIRFTLGGIYTVLGWLSHAGVAFSALRLASPAWISLTA